MNCITVASIVFLSCCSFFGLPVRLSRLWILQLHLSLGLTALVHSIWQFKARGENYRSQHVGTGRMWLLETMQPGDRSQKKVVWILQACHVANELDLLFFTEVHWAWGFSIKSQVWIVSQAFLFLSDWSFRDERCQLRAFMQSGCKSRVKGMHGWLKHFSGCCHFSAPEGELWACRGGWKGLKRNAKRLMG